MNEFDSYVCRIIKQIYKILAYEYDMGLTENQSANIYFLQFLKRLQGQSLDNIHKILKQTGMGVSENKKPMTASDTKVLLEFFTQINKMKSSISQDWLFFQHCMNFSYRNFTSGSPNLKKEILSRAYLGEMKKVANKLIQSDEGQFYLRVFSLLREYTTYSYWIYCTDKNKNTSKIARLLYHYKSYINACESVRYVFLDFEKILLRECNMNWYEFNAFIFFNYFYTVINEEILLKHKDMSEIDVRDIYAKIKYDFVEINILWRLIRKSYNIYKEHFNKNLMEDHSSILSKNFWVTRSNKSLKNFDIKRLITELLLIPCQRLGRESEPILSKTGQCLCEDCLIIKLNCFVENNQLNLSNTRVSPCRFCSDIVELNNFYKHMASHLTDVNSKKIAESNASTKSSNNLIKSSSLQLKDKSCQTADFSDHVKISLNAAHTALNEKPLQIKANTKKPELRPEGVEVPANGEKIPKDHLLRILKNYDSIPPEWKDNPNLENQSILKVILDQQKAEKLQESSSLKKDENKFKQKCEHNGRGRQCECHLSESKVGETRNRLRIGLNKRKENLHSKNILLEKNKTQLPDKNKQMIRCLERCESGLKVSDVKTQSDIVEQKLHEIKNITALTENMEISNRTLKNGIAIKKKQELMKNKKKTEPVDFLKLQKEKEGERSQKADSDIRGLVNFIEGNDPKTIAAQKKAAKRNRQRQKKEEERKKQEEEEKRLIEEKKRIQETRLNVKLDKEQIKEDHPKKKEKQKMFNEENYKNQIIEDVLQGIITIKKSTNEGDSRPTLTVTLKASSDEQDKILNNLLGEYQTTMLTKKNRKNKKKSTDNLERKIEQQVKLQVIKNGSKKNHDCESEIKLSFLTNNLVNTDNKNERKASSEAGSENVNIPFIKLPPGITITKVDGPVSNKNYKVLNEIGDGVSHDNKKGVIVVDTEKLIKKTNGNVTASKKNKNNHKNQETTSCSQAKRDFKAKGKKNQNESIQQHRVVTLKNPMFNPSLQKEPESVPHSVVMDFANNSCAQASIFKNENGMVTIRSSRLQQSLDNRIPLQNLVTDLKPIIGNDIPVTSAKTVVSSETTLSSFNAQEILSGLPGIEITKVEKGKSKSESLQQDVAQVSIIPSSSNSNNWPLEDEMDDFLYDNVFKPKDVCFEDLDEAERDVEAFKRFVQNSVPPKCKEKANISMDELLLNYFRKYNSN